MNYVTEAIARQPFATKAAMDEAIRNHLGTHGADLPDTSVDILRLLSRYACKYPGVAFLKHATIAKAVGKSRITIIRNIKRLVAAGIIEKVTFTRPVNGGKGANMYVIQANVQPEISRNVSYGDTSSKIHWEEAVKPTPVKVTEYFGGYEPLSYTKHISNTLDSAIAAKNNIPAVIYDTLNPFYNAKELRKLTSTILRAKGDKVVLESHKEAFVGLMMDVVRRYKDGKLSSVCGYMFASVKRLARRLYLTELHADVYGIGTE